MNNLNKQKLCPLCGKEMEYRPQQHWTGMRYITLQHEWVCNNRDEDGGHHLKIFERDEEGYE